MKIKIQSKRVLIGIILLLPLFKPAGIECIPIINMAFKMMKMISIIILTVYVMSKLLKVKIEKKILKAIISLGVFWVIYGLNSINNGTLDGSLLGNICISILLMGAVYYVSRTSYYQYYVKALDIIFSCWIIINIVSLFLVRDGYTPFGLTGEEYNYFLGLDNYSAFAVVPMLGILYFFDFNIYRKIRMKEKILYIGSLLSYLYVKSATAVFAFGILGLFLILQRYWNVLCRVITVRRVAAFLVILFILIYIFDFQNIFYSFLTSSVLGKGEEYYGITLNSRTIIWEYAMNLIKKKPLLGYGALSEQEIHNYALYGADHCHNIFIEILFRTGIVGCFFYFYYLFKPFKSIVMKKENKEFQILLMFMITILVIGFMDYYPTLSYLYLFYAVVYSERNWNKSAINKRINGV